MRDILPPRGMCGVSRDILKFWQTSDNISLTVRDRDIVAMEHYWEIGCGISNGTIVNALE